MPVFCSLNETRESPSSNAKCEAKECPAKADSVFASSWMNLQILRPCGVCFENRYLRKPLKLETSNKATIRKRLADLVSFVIAL